MSPYLRSLLIAVLAVFAPIKPMLIATFVLATVDLITGILAARKQGETITSGGLKRTVGKIFLYEAAILMSYVAETYLLGGIMPVTKLVAGMIGATELKSILENLDIINGSSLFTTLVSKLVNSENNNVKD